MRISSKYLLTVVLFIAFLSAGAQKNKALQGYIITLQNDTLACSFKTRNWKKQPFEIKISINGRDSTIAPEKVNGFSIPSANIIYESKLVGPALYELNMQFAINNDYKPFFDSSRIVFCRLLHKGKLALYLYEDKVERKHFFIGAGDEVTEIYKHLYATSGGFHRLDPVVEWYNQYRLILKAFLSECKSLYIIIDAMDLNEKNLVGLFKNYDGCSNTE